MLRRIRYAALVLAALGAATTMTPAAVKFPGSITITAPVREQAAKGVVEIDWVWRAGTVVKSTSKVDLAVTQNGVSWYSIGAALPIRTATHTWDTATWPDGVYAIRAVVSRTSVKSVVSPLSIDNTAPAVRVTRPAEGEVLVENERVIFFAAIVGTATLEADARDALSGVDKVKWFLGEEQIGEGTPFEYNFSTKPGRHLLRAEGIDKAGNSASHEITVLVAPGPSATNGGGLSPEELPVPDPSQSAPPAPELPEVPALPDATPPEPPTLPDGLPTAVPTP